MLKFKETKPLVNKPYKKKTIKYAWKAFPNFLMLLCIKVKTRHFIWNNFFLNYMAWKWQFEVEASKKLEQREIKFDGFENGELFT